MFGLTCQILELTYARYLDAVFARQLANPACGSGLARIASSNSYGMRSSEAEHQAITSCSGIAPTTRPAPSSRKAAINQLTATIHKDTTRLCPYTPLTLATVVQ